MQWAVVEGDGTRVSDIASKMRAMGAPERARLFLNGRPAEPNDRVEPGDRVELYPHRDSFRGRSGDDPVEILAQRDGIVLAYKPAGLPTETTRLGESSLVSELIVLLNGGRVHAASRLDVAVSGIVVCTLGRDAARRVHGWYDAGQLAKDYVAIAAGVVPPEGSWTAPLGRMRDRAGRHRAAPEGKDPRAAVTRFRRIAALTGTSALLLHPETGRMHQLRAHAALAGAPLYGDRLYGGPTQISDATGAVHRIASIALHAQRVTLPSVSAVSPLPWRMLALWEQLGGTAEELAQT